MCIWRTAMLAAVLLCACSDRPEAPPRTTVRDSLGVRLTETDATLIVSTEAATVGADELFRVGSPDDRPGSEPLFQVSAALFLADTSLVLLQAGSEILVYDAGGLLTGRSGRRGEGPGEFAQAVDLREVSGGGFEVWDADLARVTVLTTGGAFVSSRTANLDAAGAAFPSIFGMLPAFRWRLIGRDRLLVFSYLRLESIPESGRFRPPLEYLATTIDVDRVDTLGTYSGIEQVRLPPELGRGVVVSPDADDSHFAVAHTSGHLYIGDGGQDHIDRYDSSGRLDMRVKILAVDRSPQPAASASAVEELVDALERRGVENASRPVALLAESDPAPAFRGLAATPEGGLWVRLAKSDSSSYAVFDSTGLFLRTVRLPPHDRILAIADHRLAVLERSELGIESVAVYGMTLDERPSG